MTRVTRLAIKRVVDLALSISALVVLVAPFLILATLIKLDSRGPVFFRQERVGYRGRLFRPWKFRTMVVDAENMGLGINVSIEDDRICRVGKVLRNWGLDELPQMFNVVKGDMSLVGPRPTLSYQVEQYEGWQRRRLLVKPGVTGWALVNGRNRLTWQERIQFDVWYVDNWSLSLDLKILFRTLWVVLVTREGVYGEGGVNDDFQSTSTP